MRKFLVGVVVGLALVAFGAAAQWGGQSFAIVNQFGQQIFTSINPGIVTATVTQAAGSGNQPGPSPVSTPVVAATSHVSGNAVGPCTSLAIASRNGQGFTLNELMVKSLSALTPTFSVYLFHTQPATSTFTDGQAAVLSAADSDNLIAAPFYVVLQAPVSGATGPSTGESINMVREHFVGGSSASSVKTIWYCLVAASTFTAVVGDLKVSAQTDLSP